MQPLDSTNVAIPDALAPRIELPVVIRPEPIRLAEIERRLLRDASFARSMTERPDFRIRLAFAIHHRDAEARQRFATAAALADHLGTLLRG